MIDIYNPTFDKSKVVVYVVGRISGDPNFKTKFEYVYKFLKHHGYNRVIVPTCVADNLPYERYAPISLGFVQACDVVYALSDWKDSTVRGGLLMKTFKIRITETLEKEFEIEAKNKTEALCKARINYVNAEPDYILSENDYVGFDMEVLK